MPVSKMEESIEARIQASLKTARDPDGGPYPKTGSGKKFYHNVISGADCTAQPCCVDCVVFGRVARGTRTRYMLGDNSKATSLATLVGGENVRVAAWC